MKTNANRVITILFSIFILSFCQNSQSFENRTVFWYSEDYSTILERDANQWTFYMSGNHNSPVLELIRTKKNTTILKCKNWFCEYGFGTDTLYCETLENDDKLDILFANKKLSHRYLPYDNSIKWDSIIIKHGTKSNKIFHHKFVNNDFDFKSKSILAWMIYQDSFKFSKVDEKQGEEKFIFLELYRNGKMISNKIASSLFF